MVRIQNPQYLIMKRFFLSFLILITHFSYAVQMTCPPSGNGLPDHPRILLEKGEESFLLETISKDRFLTLIHKGIIEECDRFLTLPPVERTMEGKRLLHTSREALKRIFWLSYSYRLTGEDKYAARAKVEMLAVCSFADWNPSHFLDTAEMAMAAAIGYDWLYDELEENERKFIRTAINEKAFIPADDDNLAGFYNLSNNWNQVCCCGLTYAALATFEDWPDRSGDLIDLYARSVPFAMKCYAPDGGYPEGYSYWGYGTTFQVMMIAALESCLGTDFGLSDHPGFLDTASFIQFMTGPGGECFNFSDCGSAGRCNPAMFWFAARTGDRSLIWQEKRFLNELPSGFMKNADVLFAEYRLLPALIIFCKEIGGLQTYPPEDQFKVFNGRAPLFFYREGWENSTDTYLAIKGGSPTTSHAHMDAGAFVYEYNGVRWSMDLGMQDYHSLESKGIDLWDQGQNGQRWDIFRIGNESHSTLTINGKRHMVKSYVPITGVWMEDTRKGASLDMSTVFRESCDSVIREIWLDERDHLYIKDKITTGATENEVKWIMTTSAQPSIRTDGSILLEKDGKRMILTHSCPVNSQAEIWSNDPRADYDAPNPGTFRVGFIFVVPPYSGIQSLVSLKPL